MPIFRALVHATARNAQVFILAMMTLIFPTLALAEEASPTSSSALITLLKDEAARNALIADLERASATASTAVAEPKQQLSIGSRVAELTQGIAEQVASKAASTWQQVINSGSVFSGLTGTELQVLTSALGELAMALALTVVIFLTLRWFAIPFYRRMGTQAGQSGPLKTILLIGGSTVLDTLIVVVAWAIGYVVTLTATGDVGQIGLLQTLYLNAFLAVELIKVGSRLVLSPTSKGLRLLPLSDAAAKSLSRHVNVLVSVIGYGQLLILPIINQNVGFVAGRSVSVLLSVFALSYLITLVLRKRHAVSHWMLDRLTASAAKIIAEASPEAEVEADALPDAALDAPITKTGPLATLARHWHWGALTYLLAMFFIVMTRPSGAVVSAALASGKIAGALILASIISTLLSRSIAKGISLPASINMKLPLLERRLNGFVPRILLLLRLAVITSVSLFALDAAGLIDATAWLNSKIGLQLTSAAISLSLIGLVAGAIWLAMSSWVDYRLNAEYGAIPTARETTLLTLLRNAATIALLVLTAMFCLSEIGLDIGPLLASAGVLGLAIGFGSQKLVQDIITGVFIQFENAINVGDVVTVGGITGAVEKLTVRSVSLRDLRGTFHIIPFSSVDAVSNFTRDFSYFVADMGVAYREDTEEVKKAMFDGFEELRADPAQADFILADLEWLGLNSFGDSAVILRARIKTVPGKQWSMGRAYNAILKRLFDERNIEIPFPHQTLFFGEAKDGTSQAHKIIEHRGA